MKYPLAILALLVSCTAWSPAATLVTGYRSTNSLTGNSVGLIDVSRSPAGVVYRMAPQTFLDQLMGLPNWPAIGTGDVTTAQLTAATNPIVTRATATEATNAAQQVALAGKQGTNNSIQYGYFKLPSTNDYIQWNGVWSLLAFNDGSLRIRNDDVGTTPFKFDPDGTLTATAFVGDGSGLTGIAGGSGGPSASNNIPASMTLISTNCHINAATGTVFRITATANIGFTVAGGSDGQTITLAITQDGTGNRTAAFTNLFKFGTDIPLTALNLTTNAGKTDYVKAQYWAASNRWDVIGFVRGF